MDHLTALYRSLAVSRHKKSGDERGLRSQQSSAEPLPSSDKTTGPAAASISAILIAGCLDPANTRSYGNDGIASVGTSAGDSLSDGARRVQPVIAVSSSSVAPIPPNRNDDVAAKATRRRSLSAKKAAQSALASQSTDRELVTTPQRSAPIRAALSKGDEADKRKAHSRVSRSLNDLDALSLIGRAPAEAVPNTRHGGRPLQDDAGYECPADDEGDLSSDDARELTFLVKRVRVASAETCDEGPSPSYIS